MVQSDKGFGKKIKELDGLMRRIRIIPSCDSAYSMNAFNILLQCQLVSLFELAF
jgi:hypothetical protein